MKEQLTEIQEAVWEGRLAEARDLVEHLDDDVFAESPRKLGDLMLLIVALENAISAKEQALGALSKLL